MSTPPRASSTQPASEVRANTVYRFGLYTADVSSGELRKDGIKLKLQDQPFQVLIALLERPGELVTRDDLQQRLWAADTFVDFDHSLNTAINKLREALNDSAGNPRFIETLARRGYRFIAPVQVSASPAQMGSAPAAPGTHPTTRVATDGDELPQVHPAIPRLLFALAQLLYLGFYIAALVKLTDVDRVADSFLFGRGWIALIAVIITASVGIPVRLYLLTAVMFDYRKLGANYARLFPFVFPLDQLWALAPFLAIGKIGFGLGLAVCAAMLYLPFSQRTLIRMAYGWPSQG